MGDEFDAGTLERLRNFDQGDANSKRELGKVVLSTISRYGISPYPWELLKHVVLYMAVGVIEEMINSSKCTEQELQQVNDSRKQIQHVIPKFSHAPFTIQRICEIILEPRRFYSSPVKLGYALEKLLRVTCTNNDLSIAEYSKRLKELKGDKEGRNARGPEQGQMAIDVDLRPAMLLGGFGGGEGWATGPMSNDNNNNNNSNSNNSVQVMDLSE